MSRNPIYQAMRVSGVLSKMVSRFKLDERLIRAKATFELDLDALRGMRDREVITFDEYRDLAARAARPYHAAVVRLALAELSITQRRSTTMKLRSACPPSMTAYDFRMGRHAHA